MCGFVGLCSELPLSIERLRAARDVIAHRGPDDYGEYLNDVGRVGLAFRRLAIIDLTPAGHQPMTNEDGTVWLVYNGEVYNYAELKQQLERAGHHFSSNSDTEVIIHAYEEWGLDCLKKLRGMFAFGLWDSRRRRLWLVRDRLGIKPLFYYWDNTTFAFASEIKALLALPDADTSVDRSAIFDYLTYGYVPAPKTAYQYIRKLLPGHYLLFDGQTVVTECYWDVPLVQDDSLNEGEAIDFIREQLQGAVEAHLVSDVPLGVFLSGGLDSSTVTALMAEHTSELVRTFSIGFDVAEHSETGYARLVADHLRTQHHERTTGVESVQRMLPHVVSMYDEPFADSSAIPTYIVSRVAREQVKVVLSGDGGDEVFAGYRWYDRWLRQQELRALPAFIRRGLLAPLGRVWPANTRGMRIKHFLEGMAHDPFLQYARQMELFSPSEKRSILRSDWAADFEGYDDYWYFRKYWRPELDPITRLQYVDLKTYLPDDILTKVDRASMAVSLEVRPPLLDHLLIEAVFRVPAAIRFRNREKKHLLKQAVNGALPSEILKRGKKGFSSPMVSWMDEERAWGEAFLRRSSCIVRNDFVQSIAPYAWGHKFWTLLVLEKWARSQ